MKYSTEIEIALPPERVAELFGNPDNYRHWQKELVSRTLTGGTEGQPGATARLLVQMGSRQMEMTETLVSKDLPRELTNRYESKGVWNQVCNRFVPLQNGHTRLVTEQEFRISNPVFKLMAWLMPGMFKKQSMKYAVAFKTWAESQGYA